MSHESNGQHAHRILYVGGLGHIGSSLVRDPNLLRLSTSVVILDDLSTQRYGSLTDLPSECSFEFHQGSVIDSVTPEALTHIDSVVHLAAIADPGAGIANPTHLHEVNFGITKHLAEACMDANVPLIFPSSTSVYSGDEAVVTERSRTGNSRSPYAKTKLEEEVLLQAMAHDGLKVSILRLGTIYGFSPGMRFHTAVNKFCFQAALGQPIEVWSTALDQVRPYLSLSDVGAAVAHTIESSLYLAKPINLVSTNATVERVIQSIRDHGYTATTKLVDSPLMSPNSFHTSTELAQSLGYTFEDSLETAVGEILAHLGHLGPDNTKGS